MLYLLAIVLPPLAVLLCGKPVQALLNVVLTLLGWLPGMLHALLVVASTQADRRTERVIREMRQQGTLGATSAAVTTPRAAAWAAPRSGLPPGGRPLSGRAVARLFGPLLLLIGVVSLSDRLYYVATLALLVGLLLSLAWLPARRGPIQDTESDRAALPPPASPTEGAAPAVPTPPQTSPTLRRHRRARGTPIGHRP